MKDAGRTNRPASSSHFEVFDRQFVPIVMAWPLEAAKRAESTGRVPAEREPCAGRHRRAGNAGPAAKCPKATDDAGSTHQTRHRPPGSHSPERLQEGWAAAVPAATSEAEDARGDQRNHTAQDCLWRIVDRVRPHTALPVGVDPQSSEGDGGRTSRSTSCVAAITKFVHCQRVHARGDSAARVALTSDCGAIGGREDSVGRRVAAGGRVHRGRRRVN